MFPCLSIASRDAVSLLTGILQSYVSGLPKKPPAIARNIPAWLSMNLALKRRIRPAPFKMTMNKWLRRARTVAQNHHVPVMLSGLNPWKTHEAVNIPSNMKVVWRDESSVMRNDRGFSLKKMDNAVIHSNNIAAFTGKAKILAGKSPNASWHAAAAAKQIIHAAYVFLIAMGRFLSLT